MTDRKDPGSASALGQVSDQSENAAGSDDAVLKRIAHYDLTGEIGRGALSVVYDAQDTRTGQDVALKLLVLPDSLTSEEAGSIIARFEREAQAAALLCHPNIVGIRETGVDQGRHFLALERLHGQTLRKRLSAGPLPLSEAFSLLIQVAGALDAVHQAGLTHRDIKPTTVFLLPGGTVKLLEFGIAPTAGESSQRVILVGSPSYMAPEQIKGEGGTAAADIWALGVLAYEMLLGRLPFTGPSAGGVMHQIVHQPPAAMPRLPQSVQQVLLRGLDKQPDQRPATAGAFVQALRLAYPAQSPSASQSRSAASPSKPAATSKPATAASSKPAAAVPKPATVPPLAAAAEPKPAAAEPKPVVPPKAASVPMPALRFLQPAPKWLPATALSFLFLAGFGGASLLRLHTAGHAPPEPAQVSSPPHIASASSQAASLDAAPVTMPAPVPSAAPALIVPPQAQAATGAQVPLSAPALSAPRQETIPPVKPNIVAAKTAVMAAKTNIAPARPLPAVRNVALSPVPPRRPAAPAKQTASQSRAPLPAPATSRPKPVLAARLPVPVQIIIPRLPAPSAAPPVVAENSPQNAHSPVPAQASAQNTGQTFTLPAEASGYDPEAEARLRKSAWSQNGSAGTNEGPQK